MNKKVLMLAIAITASALSTAQKSYISFKADSPEIRYTGRTEKTPTGEVSFNWSGTYFETGFTGSSVAIKASDTKRNYYNVFIDGVQTGVISIAGKDTTIVLANWLHAGKHSLRLQKRSEGEQGTTTIKSIILESNCTLIPASPKKSRHIEFIGNSITCGYGTEGLLKTDPFKAETENCNLAYSCIIARYFDADYTLIAHSGRGAARNYGDTSRVSKVTMKELMDGTFDMTPENRWNFKDYTPDLVVINLGSNDFSTKPHPLKEEFLAAYDKIIVKLRTLYGNVNILCVAPPKGGAFDYLREFCISKKDKNLHFAAYLNEVYNDDTDLGSSGHPNYQGQKKIAMTLIPHISSIMKWNLSENPVK